MNGEMLQAAMDVIAAEYFRKTNQIPEKLLSGAGHSAPGRLFRFLDGRETRDYSEWIKRVNEGGIRKMIYYPNMQKLIENRKKLGFIGNFAVIQVVFHTNDKITYWQNKWEFSNVENRWNITSTEQSWENGPQKLIDFPQNAEVESLRGALQDAIRLCGRIGAGSFIPVFGKSLEMLDKNYDPAAEQEQTYFQRYIGILPKKNVSLLAACGNAFLFGSMGSWNDEPEGRAQAAGCRQEYDKISDDLLFGIVANLTYAVNHWKPVVEPKKDSFKEVLTYADNL